MRTFAALLLLASALPVTAQQSQIIGLTLDDTLTWTNDHANIYCGIEYNWNIMHTWLPLGYSGRPLWNVFVTQTVVNTGLDLEAEWKVLTNAAAAIQGNIGVQGFFLGVV